jgi:hypothetical protein
MRMFHKIRIVTPFLVLGILVSATAYSQTGSLRGYVRDESGAVVPGVTVTATSEALMRPASAVTDGTGLYRILNLPPGTYTLTFELGGFATSRQEGVVLPAGANYAVDATMGLSTVQETITVTAETPMLEIAKPSNVLNIEGEFQKEMPIAARRNWSDFLEMTPGVHSRPFDDGSGRMVYFGHATEHFAHVVQLEGMQAGNYNDFQLTYVQMGSDMIEDTQVKTGGVDASTPMGTGLAINVVTKSGGNEFSGSVGYAHQALGWNDDNTGATTRFDMPPELQSVTGRDFFESTGGTPAQNALKQLDGSFGGPIVRDKVWFFTSLRYSNVEVPISRTDENVADIRTVAPEFEPFNQLIEGYQPYAKVTASLSPTHDLAVVFQRDRTQGESSWEYFTDPMNVYGNGGNLFTGRLTSVWGTNLTSTFSAGYNNKGGADQGTYAWSRFQGSGPQIELYSGSAITGGLRVGDNLIVSSGNRQTEDELLASLIMLRGDVTYFKEGFGGSHEFQTGFFIEPRNVYDQIRHYTNDGFYLERQTYVDPSNPAAGTIPFRRTTATPIDIQTRGARDQDWAVYVQDNWRPNPRLTLNLGIRADWVKRVDEVFGVTRQNSWTVQPRVGFSYMLTEDARNVLRGSYARIGEQVMGRDAITTFGADSKVDIRHEYDNNLDGVFETVVLEPAVTTSLASYELDPNAHQPYMDEFIIGFRKQFPMEVALDVAYINRSYQHMWALLDVNGFWPSAPFQPFGGFGAVDPNRGILEQQTNNTWSTLDYQALEITVAKRMSRNFQLLGGFNRQWHKMDGTWNPTDRAGYIQPDHFANDANLYMPRGNNDRDSLPDTGNALSYGPTWMEYRGNVAGVYQAGWGVSIAASYTLQAGPWSGSPLYRIAAADPIFGPPSFTLPNGTRQTNPLSTRNRYVYGDRGEGQVQAPPIHTVGLKVGKRFDVAEVGNFEVAANIFNLLNGGDFTQYSYNSAYQTFSTNFLEMRNRQLARAFQLTLVFRF